jgi:O-acetyl-ADP-ribose deacetylase (regulator of RNase III)
MQFLTGNILDANVEALVNTVNCVGIAGRGIALQFRETFPENFKVYVKACKNNDLQPGRMLIVETGLLTNPKYIVNFPTKRHWKGKSRLEDIRAGLETLVLEVQRMGIQSIAVPPLGCGLGGLDWADVRPLIVQAFAALPHVQVLVFEPGDTRDPLPNPSKDAPTMTTGRAALVGLMDRYLGGLLDPFVSLLEVHKLMYFLQEAGEPLRLRYTKAPYGPYAENLRHVLRAMDGHFLSGYGEGGEQPEKLLEIVPGAQQDAVAVLQQHQPTLERFDRVSKLVEGFETAFGLELLSSVHWVALHDHASTPEQAVKQVHGWNQHKQQFSSRQILLAWDVLSKQGWLPVASPAPVQSFIGR